MRLPRRSIFCSPGTRRLEVKLFPCAVELNDDGYIELAPTSSRTMAISSQESSSFAIWKQLLQELLLQIFVCIK